MLIVTVCEAEAAFTSSVPKFRVLADTVRPAWAAALPVPLSVTRLTPPVALWLILMLVVRLPCAVGLNVDNTVQLALGASELPPVQLPPARLKSPAEPPVSAIEVIFKAADPVLLNVVLKAVLVWPMVVPVKTRLAGDTVATGPATTLGLPINAARSAISSAVNLFLYRFPIPPLFCANALLISVGLFAPRKIPLTLLAGLAP